MRAMHGRGVGTVGYSCVNAIETVRMKGAARMTTGIMTAQAISHDHVQWPRNCRTVAEGKLAMPAAIRLVSPDWIVPKTKWLCLRAIRTMSGASFRAHHKASGMPRTSLFERCTPNMGHREKAFP